MSAKGHAAVRLPRPPARRAATIYPGIPAPAPDWALFLDFDGTLVEIAARPEHVRIDSLLPATLADLHDALGGAVAIISGRPLVELDVLIAPAMLAAAGLHGLERRLADGRLVRAESASTELDKARQSLTALVANKPGLMLEDKGLTLALHYRQAPQWRARCRRAVDQALAGGSGDLHVLEGKMVFEIKPANVDKGKAIEAFLAEPPFRARLPVFIGDDVTDEDGFAVVERRGGITIRIGNGAPTRARWHIDSVRDLVDWLHRASTMMIGRSASREGRRRG